MSRQSLGGLPRSSSRPRRAPHQRPRSLQVEPLESRQVMAGLVSIDPAHSLGKISPDLIGTNVIYSREADALWADGSVAQSLKAIRTGFMRYPGGEVTSFYHWNRNTGVPFQDAWDGHVPVQPYSEWMSFDEYMRQVQAAGGTPLVGINIQSGHNQGRVADGVAEAVALVKYAKNRGYGVEHYFIDNEQYADNANMTATEYANYVNLYASAMRSVDPNLKIVVNWQSFLNNGWKTILDIAGRNIDYIDFHAYWNRDAATFANWRGQRLMTHAGETYFAKIQNFREEIARQGLGAKVAAFEWNLGPAKWDQRPSPFQAALMNSEVFMQFVWARLDAAAFWPLHYDASAREGEHDRSLLTAEELEHSAIYQMLAMYKELLGKQLLPVEFRGSGVLATAGYQAATDTTSVMLLEKTGIGRDLKIALGDFLKQPGSFQVQAQTFRAAGGDLQADRGEVVDIPYSIDRRSGVLSLSVGGYTLTKLTITHFETPALSSSSQSPPRAPQLPPTAAVAPPTTSPVAPEGNPAAEQLPPPGSVPTAPPASAVAAPISKGSLSPAVVEIESGSESPPAVPPLERNMEVTPVPGVRQSPPAQVSPLSAETKSPSAQGLDTMFAALATEAEADSETEQNPETAAAELDEDSLSLRALLAFVPQETCGERKRRGREAFLAVWETDEEPWSA